MNKRATITFFLSAIVILSLAVISNPALSADKPIKLLYASFEPPITPFSVGAKEWGKDLEERTNGRVKVQFSFGSALGSPLDYPQMIKLGVCDVGMVVPMVAPELFPMSGIINLPFIFPTAEIGGRAMMGVAEKGFFDKEYADYKFLFFATGLGDMVFSKKPATTLKEIAGFKLFSSMEQTHKLIKGLGAVPNMLGGPMDIYPALQKGIIDGVYWSFPMVSVFRCFEFTKYATKPGVGSGCGVFLMNKKYYQKLPKDIQKIIDEMSFGHAMKFAAAMQKMNDFGEKQFFKTGGKVINWTPETLATLEKVYASLWTEWIDKNEKKGLPARKIVDEFYNQLKSLGVEKPAVGYAPGK